MFPFFEKKPVQVYNASNTVEPIKEDFLMGTQRRIISSLVHAQERRDHLEAEINRLNIELDKTNTVIKALDAANNELNEDFAASLAISFEPEEGRVENSHE